MTDVTTKIEMVTEAIEQLTLAQVVLCSGTLSQHDQMLNAKNLVDARANVAAALKELMTPTLRVLNGPLRGFDEHLKRPAPPENIPYGGKGIAGMFSPGTEKCIDRLLDY